MSKSYWARITESRLSRRRLLRGGAAAGIGVTALSLIGCGSDDAPPATGTTPAPSPSNGTAAPSPTPAAAGLVTDPVDRTSDAVRGGTYQTNITTDPLSFDSISGTFSDVPHASRVYSRIVKYEVAKFPDPVQAAVEPDAATGWEFSPDGLQMTYRIRPNLQFDPRPPTNGRSMTAQDVKFSFDRFMEISVQRGVISNAVSNSAPVTSVETPDDLTVVVNLAFPYAPLNMIVAAHRYITIMPVEAESEYDIRQTMRGSGAWRLADFEPSSVYRYERNPDWYDAGKVHLDGMHFTVLNDPAANLAQFITGNFWYYPVPQDDVLRTKQDNPRLVMQPQEEYSAGGTWIRFGYLPDSPFLDERVRQAASMSLDRDLFIEVFGNVDRYATEGIEVPMRWNSALFAGEAGFWIDPKDEAEYGEASRFFKYDPAEARKLLAAAGITAPLSSNWVYPVGFFAGNFEQRMEVLHGMWQDSGNFALDVLTTDYNSNFGPNYTNGYNEWEGIAAAAMAARAEVDVILFEKFHSSSVRAGHLLPDRSVDTTLDAMVERQRGQTDPDERAATIKDIQRHVSSKMYLMMEPGQALGFTLHQPWLANYGVYRSRPGGSLDQEGNIHWWYDAGRRA